VFREYMKAQKDNTTVLQGKQYPIQLIWLQYGYTHITRLASVSTLNTYMMNTC